MSSPFTHEQHVVDTDMGDWETCSWCTQEVLDEVLRTVRDGDGARICPDCQRDLLDRFPDTVLEK